MKNTIIFLILLVFSCLFFSNYAVSDKKTNLSECCEVTVHVQDGDGRPMVGCTIRVLGIMGLTCITNERGECVLCVPIEGENPVLIFTSCNGKYGEALWGLCTSDVLWITVY